MCATRTSRVFLLVLACAGGCSNESGFSLRQNAAKSAADSGGAIVLEKDLLGNPLRCLTADSAGMNGTFTFVDAGHGLYLYMNDRATVVKVPGKAWDMGFALLGLSREACKELGHRYSSPPKMGWSAPPAPNDAAPAHNKITP